MAWEKRLLGGDEAAEWAAMTRAGRALAHAVRRDAAELGGLGPGARLLVLCGKGHNGGDALIATCELLQAVPGATALIVCVPGTASLRPLVRRALEALWRSAGEARIEIIGTGRHGEGAVGRIAAESFALCLDGIFGMQFRPPLRAPARGIIEAVNRHPGIGMRAAVDVPSGIGDASDAEPFRADFSYATGIAKAPLFAAANAASVGRIRYLDIGFFDAERPEGDGRFVLTPAVLEPARRLRPAGVDKRSFGHLFVVSGSRAMPGAMMMAVEAALLSGVGLVTAFVPESVAAAAAARLPEAMWVPMPETPDGGLALEGRGEVVARAARCTAWLAGPGLGRERESQILVAELLRELRRPVVLDGDALQPELVEAAGGVPLVLTPHAGEFARIAGQTAADETALRTAAKRFRGTVVLKGAPTRISDGEAVYVAPYGGPVLSRGGSGDVLAGLAGGALAQGLEAAEAAARAVVWHGRAADRLARAKAQGAARVTQLTAHLADVLKEGTVP